MRVRHLQTYLQNQRLLCTGSTESLRGLSLGLDAASWTRGLLELKDPFAEMMGGLPLGTDAAIERQLTHLAEHEIIPYFFFQGISPNGHSLFTKVDSRVISEAWTLLLNNNAREAHSKLGRIASRLTHELICHLARYLRARAFVVERSNSPHTASRPVKIIRRLAVCQCPYLSSAQIAFLCRSHILDAVLGITSFILVGLPRVITSIDFDKGKFDWVEKDQLLRAWEVNENHLANACVLAGTEYCHTLPHVSILSPNGFSFETAINLAKSGNLNQYLEFFPNEHVRNEFRHLYALSRTVLSVQIAMQGSGVVSAFPPGNVQPDEAVTHLLNQNEPEAAKASRAMDALHQIEHQCASTIQLAPVPYNIRAVHGWRLPNSLFVLMLDGLVTPDLLKALAYGTWRDFDSPIVLPEEYETLLVQCRSYRLIALGMIARHLHPSFMHRRITFEYLSRHCEDPMMLLSNSSNLTDAQYAPDIRELLPWSFDIKDVEQELQSRNFDTPSILFCLDWHLASMKKHFEHEYAALSIEASTTPVKPILAGDKFRVLELAPSDVAHSERVSKKVLATGVRWRRLIPSQNYAITLVIMTFLECIGYFDFKSTPIGAPTALGYLIRIHCHPDFEEEMIFALELLKLGLLSCNQFTYSNENDYPPALVNPPMDPFVEVSQKITMTARKWQVRLPARILEPQHIIQSVRLISRALSLTPVQLRPEVTSCPGHFLDFDIAAFQAIVKTVKRSLNHLIEGCIANIALERPIYSRLLTPEIFDPRSPRMLWFKPILGVGGVLIKAVLMSTARGPESIFAFIEGLPQSFPEVADLWGSVLRLCEFWSQLSKIVRARASDSTEEMSAIFSRADVLLCFQMWDLLPYLNTGKLPQQYPAFCALMENSLGVDLAVAMAKRPRAGVNSMINEGAIQGNSIAVV